MLLRRLSIARLALPMLMAAAAPARAHGPDHPMGGGSLGDPRKVTRTVEVTATDNAFSLKSLDVQNGETVRFVVRNEGMDQHEFLIGIKAEHAEHLKMMREMMEQQRRTGDAGPMMEHTSGVSVAPGQTASFVWTFARTADLEFACDIPGHYEDGMRGPITFTNAGR